MKCKNCKQEIHLLAVFPGGICVDCHALTFQMPSESELTAAWRGGFFNA